MKGVENEGFEKGESSSQSKTEENLEMKQQSTNDLSVYLDDPESETKDKISSDLRAKDSGNVIARWNLKSRAALGWMFGKSRVGGIMWIVFVNGVALALLVASVVDYTKHDPPEEIDWCHGVGFLWILYCLVYLGISHHLVKKYLGKSACDCLKPLTSCFVSLGRNKYFRLICYLAPVAALAAFVVISPGKTGRRKFSFFGMLIFVLLGYLLSKHPAHVKWRPVICGMALQFAFGLMTIQWETGKNVLDCVGKKVTAFLQNAEKGATFVFGNLADSKREDGAIFAFSVLPIIYFLCFFVNILSYYGALQWFIMKLSSIVRVVMGTTVCESVYSAASIFFAMTEAPLLIQSYIKDLTKSEICAILCAGWSTVAGVVMAAYIQFGVKASHLIAASVMSAPASLAFSKLVYPETEESKNTVDNIVLHKEEASNPLDAASRGALNGIMIIGSITANLIAILAFVAFLDGTLLYIGAVIGMEELSFQFLMSKLFYPISFLMGVEEDSLEDVAYLVGIKTVANEFQAYQELGKLILANKLTERSEIIATYALCGFSNFASIGISIGTLSVMEPKKTAVVTEVAIPAFIAANIVCFLTACVADGFMGLEIFSNIPFGPSSAPHMPLDQLPSPRKSSRTSVVNLYPKSFAFRQSLSHSSPTAPHHLLPRYQVV